MNFEILLRLGNPLTLLRIFLMIPFIYCFQADMMRAALTIFAVAVLTDCIDSSIARKQGVYKKL